MYIIEHAYFKILMTFPSKHAQNQMLAAREWTSQLPLPQLQVQIFPEANQNSWLVLEKTKFSQILPNFNFKSVTWKIWAKLEILLE